MTSSEIREPVRVLVFSASMRGGSLNTRLAELGRSYRQGERLERSTWVDDGLRCAVFDADYESGRYGNGPTSIRAQKP